MGEIIGDKWPYAFCEFCERLSPITDENKLIRNCLSCQHEVTVGPGNTIVFFNKKEAKTRNLPYIKL